MTNHQRTSSTFRVNNKEVHHRCYPQIVIVLQSRPFLFEAWLSTTTARKQRQGGGGAWNGEFYYDEYCHHHDDGRGDEMTTIVDATMNSRCNLCLGLSLAYLITMMSTPSSSSSSELGGMLLPMQMMTNTRKVGGMRLPMQASTMTNPRRKMTMTVAAVFRWRNELELV